MNSLTVTVSPPDAGLVPQWAALSRRAEPNVFMHPAALQAADAAGLARIRMLLAWRGDPQDGRLVGAWALREPPAVPFAPHCLAAPPHLHAFLANPVIDPACLDEVCAGFVDAIGADASLPHVLRLRCMDAQSPSWAALLRALAARGATTLSLKERTRPVATRDDGLKTSGATRKKLRQDWRRLSAQGHVELLNDRSAAARTAFDNFLALEAASWKGAARTALLCDERETTFARAMVRALSAGRNASVAMLRLDGQLVAAQVLLYAGRMAYTWKTAFDARFASFSPGALLVDRITEQLLASGDVDAIDSCSTEGGFMNQLWTGRRLTVDMLVDLGARKSFAFDVLAGSERGFERLRGARARLRSALPWKGNTASPGEK